MNQSHAERFLRRREVEERVGFSRSTIYRLIAAGNFPAPISLTQRSVRWRQSDIDGWQNSKICEGDKL